jgi:ActR/RegA family two-component response regulator
MHTVSTQAANSPIAEIPCAMQGIGQRCNILVIDDDQSVRQAFTWALQDLDCFVVASSNLGDALSCMAKESFIPDAVIVDFHLGDGSSGIDVIRLLRLRFKADLPAVIITGDASIAEADGSGVQGIRCLSKPVGYADLGRLIAAFKSAIVSAPIIPVPAMPGKSPPASQLS